MPASGSASGGRAGNLKPGHFPLPALPLQAEVRAAAADSILVAACLISYRPDHQGPVPRIFGKQG